MTEELLSAFSSSVTEIYRQCDSIAPTTHARTPVRCKASNLFAVTNHRQQVATLYTKITKSRPK